MEYLLVLALAALIVMSSGWFQRVLERRVIASLETLTGGRVEIGHFRFKPWVLQITLQKLVIHGSEAAGDPPLISAGEVDVGLNPAQLLRRRIHLRHVDVNEFQVHVRTNPQGVTNLPGPGDQTSAQQGLADLMNLFIARLTISRSAFFWNDQRLPVEINARELAMLLSMRRGRYAGTISSSATTIRWSQWSTPPITFNSRFELSPASLSFHRWRGKRQERPARLRSQSCRARSGRLPGRSTPQRRSPRWPVFSTRRNCRRARCKWKDWPFIKAEPSRRGAAPRFAKSRSSRPPSLPCAWMPQPVTRWRKTNSISPTSSSRFGEAQRRERSKQISRIRRRSFT